MWAGPVAGPSPNHLVNMPSVSHVTECSLVWKLGSGIESMELRCACLLAVSWKINCEIQDACQLRPVGLAHQAKQFCIEDCVDGTAAQC